MVKKPRALGRISVQASVCLLVPSTRSIPLPGLDDLHFRIGPAVFFPVPKDQGSRGNSYASYKPGGRPGWFMSKTYEQYAIDRAVWRVTGRERQMGAAVPPAAAFKSGVVNSKLAASR